MQIELIALHPDFKPLSSLAGIAVDLRYNSTDNFVGRDIYADWDCAWLHRDAWDGLARAVEWLHQHPDQEHGSCTLRILDAVRPHRIQQLLWDQLKGTPLQGYLADPARGSIHSFGMAVDVTLQDQAGRELDMGTGFDAMTPLSHPSMETMHMEQGLLSRRQVANRQLLRDAMRAGGFQGISTEWWHFDCGDKATVRRDFERVD